MSARALVPLSLCVCAVEVRAPMATSVRQSICAMLVMSTIIYIQFVETQGRIQPVGDRLCIWGGT